MKFDYIKKDELGTSKLIIDDYIPIKIILKKSEVPEEKFYYRYINDNDSFIEIAIDRTTCQIFYIQFVNVTKVDNVKILRKKEYINQEFGTPILPKSIFENESMITDKSKFTIYISNEKIIRVEFGNKKIVSKLKIDPYLIFYLDKNYELCSLELQNFQDKEWRRIMESINWNLK